MDLAAELDEIQFGAGTGPTVEAFHSSDPVYEPDIKTGSEWPVLAATAREVGVASVLSHGLFVSRPVGWLSQGTFTLVRTGAGSVRHRRPGILMERQRLTAGEAFDLLRRASQSLNLKLADVAARLAETGELPE